VTIIRHNDLRTGENQNPDEKFQRGEGKERKGKGKEKERKDGDVEMVTIFFFGVDMPNMPIVIYHDDELKSPLFVFFFCV
jgi:hypothetical protein